MNFALHSRKGAPALFMLLAVASLLLFPLLGREGLTDPDESAYAEAVREMAERGDWLVPHLYGEPFLDKPILIYWIMGASFRLLGESELAARLPSTLMAILLLLAVWRLGTLIHQRARAGLLSALILASSLEFALMGRAAVTDIFLTTFCTLAILCYVETLWGPGSRLLPLAVRHWSRSRRLWTAEQNLGIVERNTGERRKRLVFERDGTGDGVVRRAPFPGGADLGRIGQIGPHVLRHFDLVAGGDRVRIDDWLFPASCQENRQPYFASFELAFMKKSRPRQS
jgi:hypothetical protein